MRNISIKKYVCVDQELAHTSLMTENTWFCAMPAGTSSPLYHNVMSFHFALQLSKVGGMTAVFGS